MVGQIFNSRQKQYALSYQMCGLFTASVILEMLCIAFRVS